MTHAPSLTEGHNCSHTNAIVCWCQDVLKKEFPKGIDVIYESVGGDMFKTCLGALGQKGRLVVIGMMSQYGAGWPQSALKGVPEMLLYKSASLNGFFLIHYAYLFKQHLSQLTNFMMQGQLKVGMDSAAFRSVCCNSGKESIPLHAVTGLALVVCSALNV